jgi:hypothetical protein
MFVSSRYSWRVEYGYPWLRELANQPYTGHWRDSLSRWKLRTLYARDCLVRTKELGDERFFRRIRLG